MTTGTSAVLRGGGPAAGTLVSRTPADALTGVARNSLLGLAGAVCAAVCGLALTVLVARGEHASGAGRFFQVVALVTIAGTVLCCGADTGLVRAYSRLLALDRPGDLRGTTAVALLPVVVLGAVAAAGTWLLAPVLAGPLFGTGSPPEVGLLRLVAPFLLVAGPALVLAQGSRGLGGVLPFVLIQNVGLPVLRLGLVALAIVVASGASAAVLAWCVPLLLAAGGGALVLRTGLANTRAAPPTRDRRALAVEFWRFAAVRGAASGFDISLTWLDVILVGSMLSAREAGVYAAASRCVTTGTLALQALRLAIAPQISAALARKDSAWAESIYRTATVWVTLSSWPLYLVLAVFAPVVLRVFGAGFDEGATALTVLSAAMLVNVGTGNVQTVLLMGGRSSWVLANKAAALAVNVGLNLLLIPILGITGSAYAWAASILIDNLAAAVEVRCYLHLRGYGTGFALAIVASSLCFGGVGLAARMLLGDNPLAVLATLGVGGVAYLGLCARFASALQLRALMTGAGLGSAGKETT